MSNGGYLELLQSFRREFGPFPVWDEASPMPADEDTEIDESFIDDRDEKQRTIEEIFDTFEQVKDDPNVIGQAAIDRLDQIIPYRDTDARTFEEFFAGLGIAHFRAHELLRMGGGNGSGPCAGKNKLPARSLWPNIVPTIRALDRVRANLGYALNTTSVYRHKGYNDCLREQSSGVAKYSRHMNFQAIDFQGVSGNPTEWHSAVLDLKASHPEFGIWTRRYGSFVHIDTRGAV